MKLKSVVLLVVAVVALSACNRGERASVTGSYGSAGVLSGEVVMGSDGATPAGVNVSVRGTGMATVLGPDGRFSFVDVPEGATLDFRRSDGIDAALGLDQSSGSIVVTLDGKSAKKSSRRRGVARSTEKIYEIEGVIRAVAADSVVVFSSKKVEQTIMLAPETVVRKGGTILTAADLLVDMRVHVKARKAADVLTAVAVIVQNDGADEDEEEVEVEGTVVSVGAADLVVATAAGNMTVQVDASTVITKNRLPITLAEIAVGDFVDAEGTSVDATTILARKIKVKAPELEEVEVDGQVVSVGASDLVVATAAGNVTVQTNASTVIKQGKTMLTLADIQVGDQVEAEGTRVDATTILARKISVEREEEEAEEVEVEGDVVSVGATDLVIATDGGNVTVQTDASTVIRRGKDLITLAQIVPGNEVEAEGTRVDATTILAKKIKVEND